MSDHTLIQSNTSVVLNGTRVALYIGGLTAILASLCCVGFFLFTATGISRTTSLYLITLAEWARIPLLLVSVAALVFSYKRIWHPIPTFQSDDVCINPRAMVINKVFFCVVASLVTGMFMLPHLIPIVDH